MTAIQNAYQSMRIRFDFLSFMTYFRLLNGSEATDDSCLARLREQIECVFVKDGWFQTQRPINYVDIMVENVNPRMPQDRQ
jgi:hypothetical protein